MQNILFITWDGPQTNYMEGLFMPIFKEIQSKSNYTIHIVQFTWATNERIAITKKAAKALNIKYTSRPIYRKPTALLGSLLTLFKGTQYLKDYIKKNKIDIVMPRSTMPSIMINRLKDRNFKLLFDADGLPLEERVDFSGLLQTSKQYRFLKKEEYKMLVTADGVITRSEKAIAIHLKTLKTTNFSKFSVVLNGRDTTFFKPNLQTRERVRKELNVQNNAKLFVYCGSLGPQYGWDEMMTIFQKYHQNYGDSKFLILTGNNAYAQERISKELEQCILLKKVPFEEVPKYLSAADIAFAIRQPKYSMQAIAPIKLGEYLLMGIPTIASAGIGDSQTLIEQIPNCHLFYHNDEAVTNALQFITDIKEVDHEAIRNFGINYVSIEKSANSYIKALDKLS